MASVVDICNMALGELRARSRIQSLGEASVEAEKCSLYYTTARDGVLEKFDWDFAEGYATLAQSGTPPSDWLYQYAVPGDMVTPREIIPSGGRGTTPVPFKLATNSAGSSRVLLCDQESVTLRYTRRVETPGVFSSAFIHALSLLLAAKMAVSLTGDQQLAESKMQAYLRALSDARSYHANRRQPDEQPESTYITARG